MTGLSEAHYSTLDILLARYIKPRMTVTGEKKTSFAAFS